MENTFKSLRKIMRCLVGIHGSIAAAKKWMKTSNDAFCWLTPQEAGHKRVIAGLELAQHILIK